MNKSVIKALVNHYRIEQSIARAEKSYSDLIKDIMKKHSCSYKEAEEIWYKQLLNI